MKAYTYINLPFKYDQRSIRWVFCPFYCQGATKYGNGPPKRTHPRGPHPLLFSSFCSPFHTKSGLALLKQWDVVIVWNVTLATWALVFWSTHSSGQPAAVSEVPPMTLSLPPCKEAQAGHTEREWCLGSPRGCSYPNWDIERAAKEIPWTSNPVQPSDNVSPSHHLTTGERPSGTCTAVPRPPTELGERTDGGIKPLHFGVVSYMATGNWNTWSV